MISSPYLMTSPEAKQNAEEAIKTDEWKSSNFNAARVSVITSTYSVPPVSPANTNDNAIKAANTNSTEKKDEAKKPYGGRPLKYECSQCQRRFHAPSHLKRHVMSHSTERPFQCSVCGKGFLQAWHLGRHMTTHTGNKPFKCMECSKSFGSRFEMRTHINYIHKGIKEHKCNVCGKHFTLRSNLKVHMRKHTGEKPYQCTFCTKRFGQRGHLQYHIRKHEGKEECVGQQQLQQSRMAEKNLHAKNGSVSENSDCHDDDGECDSGIGSYDSEAELSNCSSPVLQENFDDQPFGCNNTSGKYDRPSSPEFRLLDKPHRSPLKRSHQETHMSELKPFVCYSCNCGFSEINSLRAHVRHSHPKKGIVVGDYRCAFCLCSYSSMEMLHDHIRKHQHSETNWLSDLMVHKHDSCHAEQAVEKPKMSAKSLAFSIENICADTNAKSPAKPKVVHIQPDLVSPRHSPVFHHMMMPSVPVSSHSGLSSNSPSPHCNSGMHAQMDAFCQCHLDLLHLRIR